MFSEKTSSFRGVSLTCFCVLQIKYRIEINALNHSNRIATLPTSKDLLFLFYSVTEAGLEPALTIVDLNYCYPERTILSTIRLYASTTSEDIPLPSATRSMQIYKIYLITNYLFKLFHHHSPRFYESRLWCK